MEQLGQEWVGKDVIIIYREKDDSILSARGKFINSSEDFVTIETAGNRLAISKSAIVKVKLPLEKLSQGEKDG